MGIFSSLRIEINQHFHIFAQCHVSYYQIFCATINKLKTKLKTNYDNILNDLTLKLTSIDIYILKRYINHNVQNAVKNVIKTHEKKLRNLTKNMQLPFTSDEAIKIFSRYKLTEAETSIQNICFIFIPYK